MITRDNTPDGASTAGTAPASRIVRIGAATWPLVVALIVIATVALAGPHDAWLPWAPGPATPADWERVPGWLTRWLARMQIATGSAIGPRNPVVAAIALAAVVSALAAAALASALRTAGLSVLLAALLALVAALAPYAGWQAMSPMGAAPLSLASTVGLWWFVRSGRHPGRVPRPVAIAGLLVLAGAAVGSGRHGARTTLAMWEVMRGDLGWPGLVLLAAPFARGIGSTVSPWSVFRVVLGLLALSTPADGTARAALVLPWVWWLTGTGLSTLLSWRGPRAGRWAALALVIWAGLHAGRVPWGHQRQQAALVRTWAEGFASLPSPTRLLAAERSARGALLVTLVDARDAREASPPPHLPGDVRAAVRDGKQVLVLGDARRERLRWGGVALVDVPATAGVGLDRLLEHVPSGTVVLAALSRDAAARLTPAHWQSLGRMGLRLVDAGTPRAHALVGVARTRVDALEVAQPGTTRLDVVPGDPIGRTGARSPVDARLEADEKRVRVYLRGRPLVDTSGLVLVFVTTRGDVLAWRAGTTPALLDGPPLGAGPVAAAMGMRALPCVNVEPNQPTDVSAVTVDTALGITLTGPGRIHVTLTRPEGFTSRATVVPATTVSPIPPAIVTAGGDGFSVDAATDTHVGVHLRGPVQRAAAVSTVAATLCAAWPAVPVVDPQRGRVDMPMAPEIEPYLGGGWHAIETADGKQFFRWMAGPRATLSLAFKTAGAVRFGLDAQGVAAPGPRDVVRLIVNGRDAGTRALLPTRGIYIWDIDAARLDAGLNTFTLETTQTVRPTDRQAGADDRVLGLAVHGWSVERP